MSARDLAAQHDPGPRSGRPAAGNPYPTLDLNERAFFNRGFQRFSEQLFVSGGPQFGKGLGPSFNGASCAQCHAQPAAGGSSPGLASPQNPVPNPQVSLAVAFGATNVVPSFITKNGPVREVRFILNPDGSPDGTIHDLYTITGRHDAKGCNLTQPKFADELAAHNVAFRIPSPVFGLGLVENTPDATLRASLASTETARTQLGIGGRFNTSENDGTITRFGWKAQDKSLLMFAAEALSVEQGGTSELFPNKRDDVAGCVFNATPEDTTKIKNPNTVSRNLGSTVGLAWEMSSDIVNFAAFMRLSAPPTPGPQTESTRNGATLFDAAGCALCHTTTLTTADSPYTGMGRVTYHPFSDFALHRMGPALADGIIEGKAGADEFRTAPLWGIGQRLFFLHDGRTSDLLEAILAHTDSADDACPDSQKCKSDASVVIHRFKGLKAEQQQDILNFLRSL